MRHNVEFTLSRAGGLQQQPRHFLSISSIVLWQITSGAVLQFDQVLEESQIQCRFESRCLAGCIGVPQGKMKPLFIPLNGIAVRRLL